ncbi:MAG: DUF4065 domain-containing protein [Synergistaceae bacterium]|nr:DUF4065 domain-containing protein [Synergistaceae bacterium]
MPWSVLDVARWILAEAGRQGLALTHMQLQKLLYYAQGWSLGMTGEPLFADAMEAWEHGPVAPAAYQAYRRWGSERIGDVPDDVPPPDASPLIALLVREKGQLSASALRNMTHDEAPWRDAARGGLIGLDAMREWFIPIFWGSDEEDEYQPAFDDEREERRYLLDGLTREERDAIF